MIGGMINVDAYESSKIPLKLRDKMGQRLVVGLKNLGGFSLLNGCICEWKLPDINIIREPSQHRVPVDTAPA